MRPSILPHRPSRCGLHDSLLELIDPPNMSIPSVSAVTVSFAALGLLGHNHYCSSPPRVLSLHPWPRHIHRHVLPLYLAAMKLTNDVLHLPLRLQRDEAKPLRPVLLLSIAHHHRLGWRTVRLFLVVRRREKSLSLRFTARGSRTF